MVGAGLAMAALAKQPGTWQALEHVQNAVVPPDLAEALLANPAAKGEF